jgi:hypothetical protein
MRPRNPDLDDFREYLKLLSLNESTIRVYATQVRSVIKAVPAPTRDDLTEHFYSQLDSHARASARVAWRHYVDFRKQLADEDVAEPMLLPRARARQMVTLDLSLPSSVQSAISILLTRDKWDLRVIADAKWGEFRFGISSRFGDTELVHPIGKVEIWPTTEETLRPLRTWAHIDGTPSDDQPLVPVATNMRQPASLLMLKKALRLS